MSYHLHSNPKLSSVISAKLGDDFLAGSKAKFADKFDDFSEFVGQDLLLMLTLAVDSMLQEDHWNVFSNDLEIKELSKKLTTDIRDLDALNDLGDLLLTYKKASLAYFFYCYALKENVLEKWDTNCEHVSLLQLAKILYCRSLGLKHSQLAQSLILAKEVFDFLFTHYMCEEAESYAFDTESI